MRWRRVDSLILLGAILGGLFVAAIVALPRWVVDSRMVLEVRFENPPSGTSPVFKLRYDRGRGLSSLRVTEPFSVGTEDPERFRWIFDARPMELIQLEVTGWSGPLAIESAVLEDLDGDLLYEFDPNQIRAADEGVIYPLEQVDSDRFSRLILPVSQPGGLSRPHRFSFESVKATAIGFVLGAGVFLFAFQLCLRKPFGLGWIGFFRIPYPVAGEANVLPRPWVLSSLILLGALVLLRSWENFLHPSLFVEDAFHYFNFYYNSKVSFWDALLRHPNGYLNILPNVMAWAFAWMDVRSIPGAYVGFAVTFTLFAASLPLLTGWFRNRWIAFVVPLVLGLSGMNHIFYYTTLTFQMYVSVLVLLGMMFLPASRGRLGLALRILIGVLLVFSGPYSVVAVPVGLMLLVLFQPSRQSFFWASMVFAGIVFLETSSGMVRLQNALEPSVLERMGRVMVERVLFFDWGIVEVSTGIWIVGALIVLAYLLLWNDASFRRIGTVFLAIVALAMAPLFLSWKFLLYSDPYDCHVLISQFFWLMFLLYAADRISERFGGLLKIAPIFAVLFVAFVGIDQVKSPNKRFYPPNPETIRFVERVKIAEELHLEDENEFVILDGVGASQEAFAPHLRVGSKETDARQRTPEELGLKD